MKIYIATASNNVDNAQRLAEVLRRKGYTVVSTWHDDREIGSKRSGEHLMTPVDRCRIAQECMQEIVTADEVAAIGHLDMRGALWECGYAMGLGKPVRWMGDKGITLFAERCLDFSFGAERVKRA